MRLVSVFKDDWVKQQPEDLAGISPGLHPPLLTDQDCDEYSNSAVVTMSQSQALLETFREASVLRTNTFEASPVGGTNELLPKNALGKCLLPELLGRFASPKATRADSAAEGIRARHRAFYDLLAPGPGNRVLRSSRCGLFPRGNFAGQRTEFELHPLARLKGSRPVGLPEDLGAG
ncbi:hypothetical protein CSOJ01_10120 [Colletotrichum sojae]|uniref:Uncharacterized protein n=1 Tax=Colletotrichum sojae TaxID=2175907 RepID=A0A8H6MQK6_9PEZI|nr:hypothetical protein CSOJ01_10120 [Colletotrichum sojae]